MKAARCLATTAALVFCGAVNAKQGFTPPTEAERLEDIRRARVWESSDVSSKDLFAGPPGRLPFHPGDEVACDFVPRQMKGWTEKFTCRLDDGNEVKVKYIGPSDYKEAYGEVLGTRLFWALGFYSDRMIPVHVTCRGCPQRPWDYVNVKRRVAIDDLPHEAMVGTYRFPVAAIEEPIEGETIECEDRQGWDWKELDLVDPSAGGSSKVEIDALKLLNAFVQNADNKAAQNTLKITPRGPIMYVDDLGSVFGEGGMSTGGSGRIDYDGWKSREIWDDAPACKARLASIGGFLRKSTLKDPVIGEGGRKLLAELLGNLSDRQIADLFRVADVERLGLETREGDRGERAVTIDDWVALFKAKRREITDRPPCPTP
ncbi:MAG TPA: hypothetical protein VJ826_01540 [Candidatus Polarisedimenticolaceae bacterium]|nr:hypothetical protein [Candidatus Polarisedimenticolaceae bacterium]